MGTTLNSNALEYSINLGAVTLLVNGNRHQALVGSGINGWFGLALNLGLPFPMYSSTLRALPLKLRLARATDAGSSDKGRGLVKALLRAGPDAKLSRNNNT